MNARRVQLHLPSAWRTSIGIRAFYLTAKWSAFPDSLSSPRAAQDSFRRGLESGNDHTLPDNAPSSAAARTRLFFRFRFPFFSLFRRFMISSFIVIIRIKSCFLFDLTGAVRYTNAEFYHFLHIAEKERHEKRAICEPSTSRRT